MSKTKIKHLKKPTKSAKKPADRQSPKNDTVFAFTTPTILGSMFLTSLWQNSYDVELEDMVKGLCTIQQDVIENNKTEYLESTLLNQVHMLNGLFIKLSAKSLESEYVKNMNIYMQLALNAQKQARATITALANLKNPMRTTFIKQQNNAVNQQVNNSEPQVLKKSEKNPANELLSDEVNHDATVDYSGTQATSNVNSPMAAMEPIHRS